MKYKNLIWVVIRGLLVIGLVALVLFEVWEKVVAESKGFPKGVFVVIMIVALGWARSYGNKIALREIKKQNESEKASER